MVHRVVILFMAMTGPQPSARAAADPRTVRLALELLERTAGRRRRCRRCRSVIAENAVCHLGDVCEIHPRAAPPRAGVSTTDQDLAIQRTRLHEAGCEKLFEEKISGARKKRPVLERLLSELRADDVVVVTRLDRLARSTSELLRIAETIEEKNAGLQSIAEPWADTTTPAGRMVLTVFAGIAEFERSLIATRTEEGRRAAQARGVSFGRPPKLRPDQRTLARNLIEEGKPVSDVARTFNVHVATIYRCLHDEAAL